MTTLVQTSIQWNFTGENAFSGHRRAHRAVTDRAEKLALVAQCPTVILEWTSPEHRCYQVPLSLAQCAFAISYFLHQFHAWFCFSLQEQNIAMLDLEYSDAQSDLDRDYRRIACAFCRRKRFTAPSDGEGFGAPMRTKPTKSRSFIFYYCAICVFIGCVETAMNQKMFEQNHPSIKPLRTLIIKPAPIEPPQYVEFVSTSDECPSPENVADAIEICEEFINDTQRLVVAIRNEGDAEECKFRTRLQNWRDEASQLKADIDSRIGGCSLLLGATGYQVHPELPLALENLKRAGRWLEVSVAAAQAGNLIDAVDYISYSRKATVKASKLVSGTARPNARTALIQLPKRLQKVALVYRDPA